MARYNMKLELNSSAMKRLNHLRGNTNKIIRVERKELISEALSLQGGTIKDWADTKAFLCGQSDELDSSLPKLYCNITGQPIGTLSIEAVDMYRKSRKSPNRQDFFDTLTLASQPAPHWMNRSPSVISRNLELDPRGFFMFMMERAYSQSFTDHKSRSHNSKTLNWKTSEDCAAWLRTKIEAFAQISALDIKLIIRANRALAWVDAKIGLPRIHIPFSTPMDFDSSESLRILIKFLSGFLEEYSNDEGAFNAKYHPEPNKSVNSAIMGERASAPEMTQKEFMKTQLTAMLMEDLDASSDLGQLILSMKSGLSRLKMPETPIAPIAPAKPVYTQAQIMEASKASIAARPKAKMTLAELVAKSAKGK